MVRTVRRLLDGVSQRAAFAEQHTDLWNFSDQFCSLVFTLSNLYFVGCAYSKGFDERWSQCIGTRAWGVPFVLAALPLLVRFVQSIKRWVDSKLVTHLINVSPIYLTIPSGLRCVSAGRKVWHGHSVLSRVLQLETSRWRTWCSVRVVGHLWDDICNLRMFLGTISASFHETRILNGDCA